MTTTAFEALPVATASVPRPLRYLRAAFIFATNLYAIGLVTYLVLRLLTGDSLWWLALLNTFAPYYFLPLLVLMPLLALFRMGRTLARPLPLALVGALWFGPYYLPKALSAPAGPSLKVVTFNVFPVNSRLEDVAGWLRTIDADVVLLQEVPTERVDLVLAALSDVYNYRADAAGTQHIFTRYPIRAQNTLRLAGNWPILRLTLDVDGQSIAVYNVHLAMPVGETPRLTLLAFLNKLEFALKYDDSVRNAQIMRLLDILQDEPLPYIAAGDFNMSDQSVIYGQLAAAMGDSFREAGSGLGASWPAGASEELPPIFPPLLRLDYIWHSDHFHTAQATQGPELGSDHLPLVAVLELPF